MRADAPHPHSRATKLTNGFFPRGNSIGTCSRHVVSMFVPAQMRCLFWGVAHTLINRRRRNASIESAQGSIMSGKKRPQRY